MTAAPYAPSGGIRDAWRTLDLPLLIIVAVLIAFGLVFAMAASPSATARMDLDDNFHFATRHALWALAGIAVLFAAAAMPLILVRRLSAILFLVTLIMVAIVAIFAPAVKGASRWIDLGPVSMQPSEFLKPAIIVCWAWMLSEHLKRPSFPGHWVALALFAPTAVMLIAQPDVGQTVLLGAIFAIMLLLAGVSWRWLLGGSVIAALLGWLLYTFVPHVRLRVDAFLNPTEPGEPATQVGLALDAIRAGGILGRGPGEGTVKLQLPDAHSDFIFAVGAEEFGLFAAIGLVVLYGWLLWRGLSRASRLIDPFAQLAASGLIALIAAQAGIHMAVNLSLIPAKGMTLPFVSYGGSSMLGACLAAGFALALLRRRPGAYLYEGQER